MFDLETPNARKLRRDFGMQNMVRIDHPNPSMPRSNAHQQAVVHRKIEHFCARAVYPQQLTMPRQFATTRPGVMVFRILEGREIDGIKEPGVRVVVQENADRTRFVMSPLLASKHDARMWAKRQMGVN